MPVTADDLRRWLISSPNWCGLALASVPLVLKALGVLGPMFWLLSVMGYVVGLLVGGLVLGFPPMGTQAWVQELTFQDQGTARQSIEPALQGIRALVSRNPEARLSGALSQQVLQLCGQLETLLQRWEGSKGSLSLEDEFHARHLALRYLPEALTSYLAIPPEFASRKVLDNGKTAHDTLQATLNDLSCEVEQLTDDLAAQDAQAFLSHSRFLDHKFGQGASP